MATIYPFDQQRSREPLRWAVGVSVSSRCTSLDASLVAADGVGWDARFEVRASRRQPLDRDIAAGYRQLVSGSAGPATLIGLRQDLTHSVAETILDMLSETAMTESPIAAVGLNDPGLWGSLSEGQPGYLALSDPSQLAELTGLNVVDAFPDRDLAQHGQGGPIKALAEWMLLGTADEDRILLDLGRTTRLTFLPLRRDPHATSRIVSFDVGPGTELLDGLVTRLTGGQHRYDPGGRLAVQGQRIPDLLNHWLADRSIDRPLPRWSPRGVRPERFLNEAMRMAVESGWTIRDLLCTATHFVAELVVHAVRQRTTDAGRLGAVIVDGGGQQNGMLLREIAVRLDGVPLLSLSDLGLADEALEAACVAILAFFHLDQVPANLPAVTGAEISRVLGRLTPGSPQNWGRLVQMLAQNRPAVRSLRSAL